MPLRRLKNFLDTYGVKYSQQVHSTAYTAAAVASISHVKGREMAKSVMVMADDALIMVVIPASTHVKLKMVKHALKAKDVTLAAESEFAHMFPDCEVGAMPPFGNLYGIPVYVDESLTKDTEIAFNAGNHRELMKIKYADYVRLVKPEVVRIATHTAEQNAEEALETRSF